MDYRKDRRRFTWFILVMIGLFIIYYNYKITRPQPYFTGKTVYCDTLKQLKCIK